MGQKCNEAKGPIGGPRTALFARQRARPRKRVFSTPQPWLGQHPGYPARVTACRQKALPMRLRRQPGQGISPHAAPAGYSGCLQSGFWSFPMRLLGNALTFDDVLLATNSRIKSRVLKHNYLAALRHIRLILQLSHS